MNNILKYRFVAFALVVVFGVFNIGIPILIASCPMATTIQGNRCGMCNDQDDPGTAKITTEKNTSCCATRFAAEGNTNEFVQAKGGMPDVNKLLLVVLTANDPISVFPSPVCVVRVSSSPPAVVDLPILISSLRI